MPVLEKTRAVNPSNALQIDLRNIQWEARGELLNGSDAHPRCQLSAIIRIAGADHHLEAIEVCKDNREQYGVNGAECAFEDMSMFIGEDKCLETVDIEGRRYVLMMVPAAVKH